MLFTSRRNIISLTQCCQLCSSSLPLTLPAFHNACATMKKAIRLLNTYETLRMKAERREHQAFLKDATAFILYGGPKPGAAPAAKGAKRNLSSGDLLSMDTSDLEAVSGMNMYYVQVLLLVGCQWDRRFVPCSVPNIFPVSANFLGYPGNVAEIRGLGYLLCCRAPFKEPQPGRSRQGGVSKCGSVIPRCAVFDFVIL